MEIKKQALVLSKLIKDNKNKQALKTLNKMIEFKSKKPNCCSNCSGHGFKGSTGCKRDSKQSWFTMLNQFKIFFKQIKGFVGIGSAPEFLERLMWKNFTKKIKKEIIKKKIYNLKYGDYEYPISYQLIKDGRKNKILGKKIKSLIPVTMIHGSKDEVVPVSFSRKVLSVFPNAQKKLVVIKNGDHSLSNQVPLKKIVKELKSVVKNII